MLTKKSRFSARSPPSKLVYFGAQGALRKNLGSVSQKWISQNSAKGDPLGRHGVEFLRGKGIRPLPPESAGGMNDVVCRGKDSGCRSKRMSYWSQLHLFAKK